jgi:oxalate decarboxylase/phosphoglucose isomerase-like protein (cupin superfamily)
LPSPCFPAPSNGTTRIVTPTVYKAGDSWVEGSQIHAFRNIGTGTVQLMASFITAKGQALRTDEAAPACADGLGL